MCRAPCQHVYNPSEPCACHGNLATVVQQLTCCKRLQHKARFPRSCIAGDVTALTRATACPAAGLLLQKELDYLDGAVSNPKRPFVAIVGGSKVGSGNRKQPSAALPSCECSLCCVSQVASAGFEGCGNSAVSQAASACLDGLDNVRCGGLQVSSKIDVIKTLLEKADKVIIVGGMVFTFDKAMGRKVGASQGRSC